MRRIGNRQLTANFVPWAHPEFGAVSQVSDAFGTQVFQTCATRAGHIARAFAAEQRYHPRGQFSPLDSKEPLMARIPETLRLGIIDANITHWTEAEVVNGAAILIVVG